MADVCEFCGGSVRDDDEGHVRVCEVCGRVESGDGGKLEDSGRAWNQEGHFMPVSLTAAPAAEIGGRHAGQNTSGAGRKILKRTAWLCSSMSLAANVLHEAQRLARVLAEIWRGSSMAGAAISVYCAGRRMGFSITAEDIAKQSGVPAHVFLRIYGGLKHRLSADVPAVNTDELVRRYRTVIVENAVQQFGLQPPASAPFSELLNFVRSVAESEGLVEGRDPKGLAAAIVIFALQAMLREKVASTTELLTVLTKDLCGSSAARSRYEELCNSFSTLCEQEVPWAEGYSPKDVFMLVEDLMEVRGVDSTAPTPKPPPAYIAARKDDEAWNNRIDSAKRRLAGTDGSSEECKTLDRVDIEIEEDMLRGVRTKRMSRTQIRKRK